VGIYIKNIENSNWRECIKLDVNKEQRSFIQSNLHSIAESKFQNEVRLLGIYKDNIMVGFASYILDEEGDMNLYKLMIDKHYQGKGYGKESLILVMDIIRKETKNKEVWLSLHPNNTVAIKLYNKFGFKKEVTGLETEDEIFLKYDFLE